VSVVFKARHYLTLISNGIKYSYSYNEIFIGTYNRPVLDQAYHLE